MSSPIIFKRTKSKPNHRSRQTSPDAAGPVESERKEGESPSALAAKLKKRAKTKTTLRFGDEKRDRLRTVGTAGKEEDYISLTVTKEDDEYRGPHPESRLMREEDELGEGDDEFAEYTSAQERIALGKKSKKLEEQKRHDAMKEMMADAEEDDEEAIQWEQEQMRRGGHVQGLPTEQQTKPTYKAVPIPPATAVPTLGPVMARITKSLSDLKISHATTTSSLASISSERVQIESRQADLRATIGRAEAKRSWFAAFREWVETVATFLDEKYIQLERVEKKHISIVKERSEMIASRRHADDDDDLALIFGDLVPSSLNGPEEVDDLGRVIPKANSVVLRRERQAARAARRLRRQTGLSQPKYAEEGYSTDSSLSPPDSMDYSTAMNEISADVKDVLEDVHAIAFQDPSQGLGKWFGEWRNQYNDTYTSAWGGMGLVAAWEFWVRLEMVGWNPFEESKMLDTFAWYQSLYRYSHSTSEDAQGTNLSSADDLVSAMVSTSVIPRLCKIIEGGAFDPYSAHAVTKAVAIAKELETFVAVDHVKFHMLLKSVQSRFQQAVAETEDLVSQSQALLHTRFDPAVIPARQRYLARRTKIIQNILRWREHIGEKFGVGGLVTRIVNKTILPVAETGWEVGGEHCVRKLVELLPPELIPQSMAFRLHMA